MPEINTTVATGTSLTEPFEFGKEWSFVDEVVSWTGSEGVGTITTRTYVDPADPLIRAHRIGGRTLMPGVLLVEIVGQSALLLASLSSTQPQPPGVLARCSARYMAPALPGDTIECVATVTPGPQGSYLVEGELSVGPRTICQARLVAARAPQDMVADG